MLDFNITYDKLLNELDSGNEKIIKDYAKHLKMSTKGDVYDLLDEVWTVMKKKKNELEKKYDEEKKLEKKYDELEKKYEELEKKYLEKKYEELEKKYDEDKKLSKTYDEPKPNKTIIISREMDPIDFNCCVCFEPLSGKVFQCMLGQHNVCENCKDSIKSIGNNCCPMDRTPGGFIPNPFFEKDAKHHLTKSCKWCFKKFFTWDNEEFSCHEEDCMKITLYVKDVFIIVERLTVSDFQNCFNHSMRLIAYLKEYFYTLHIHPLKEFTVVEEYEWFVDKCIKLSKIPLSSIQNKVFSEWMIKNNIKK